MRNIIVISRQVNNSYAIIKCIDGHFTVSSEMKGSLRKKKIPLYYKEVLPLFFTDTGIQK